jgi:hypothetical protein
MKGAIFAVPWSVAYKETAATAYLLIKLRARAIFAAARERKTL